MERPLQRIKIRTKILALVLAVCLFSVLSMSITALIAEKRIANYSQSALIGQAQDYLEIIAHKQSASGNGILESITFNVGLIEGVVRDIFNHQDVYASTHPVIKRFELKEDEYGEIEYQSTYTLSKNIPFTEEIRHELDLLSNLSLLLPMHTGNTDIVGLYVGMESGLSYSYTNISDGETESEYDPRERPWYISATQKPDRVIFTEVYEDAFGRGRVLTAAKAIFLGDDSSGELLGVAGVDILLDDFRRLISDTSITASGYAFIIDKEGNDIVHPDMEHTDNKHTDNEKSVLAKTALCADKNLAEGYRLMMNGEYGWVEGEIDGKKVFLTFSSISAADWSLGVIIFKDELLFRRSY